MKKTVFALLCLLLSLTTACGRQKDDHSAAVTVQDSGQQTETASEAPAPSSSTSETASGPQAASDNYPCDIAADRATFDDQKIDITVGDKLYMTQINDWYTNFSDYDGKSVVIEGYYMVFNDKYTFVGRKGPVCPYCTGGYVNFEFKSDQNLSALVSESSWIRVTGILRQGTMYPGNGQPGQPFYYIEAIQVEKRPEVGIDTITN
ncbi:MAG: hypothetical protein VB023_11025 [Oscillibacter sp.]|nr:hypothetical protein [Oscillibacter sp.]